MSDHYTIIPIYEKKPVDPVPWYVDALHRQQIDIRKKDKALSQRNKLIGNLRKQIKELNKYLDSERKRYNQYMTMHIKEAAKLHAKEMDRLQDEIKDLKTRLDFSNNPYTVMTFPGDIDTDAI